MHIFEEKICICMLQTLAVWFFSVAAECNDFYNNLTYKNLP